jgi:hypothetical protein
MSGKFEVKLLKTVWLGGKILNAGLYKNPSQELVDFAKRQSKVEIPLATLLSKGTEAVKSDEVKEDVTEPSEENIEDESDADADNTESSNEPLSVKDFAEMTNKEQYHYAKHIVVENIKSEAKDATKALLEEYKKVASHKTVIKTLNDKITLLK